MIREGQGFLRPRGVNLPKPQHHYLSLEPLADLGQSADEDQILLVPPAAAPILTPRSA